MSRLSAINVYCLILLGLIGVSCAAKPTPVPTPPNPVNDFPLRPGNTWTYLVGRYDGFNPSEIMTTARVMTETVVEVKTVSSYSVATMRQDWSAEFPIYVPQSMQDISPNPATSSEYWLIVDGNRVYRQERNLDLSNPLSKGALDFTFPLSVGVKWYESDEMAKLNPSFSNDSMLHKVMKIDTVAVPAGRFENCYFLTETIGGSTLEDWFCPGMGYVDRKNEHGGTPFGGRQILIRYHLEK